MQRFMMVCRQAPSNKAVTVIDMEGDLDTGTADDFEELLKGLLEKRQYKIVLNMRDLAYISSPGFGVLISLIREIRKKGGDIKIANLQPIVYDVFCFLELPTLFHILDDEQAAVKEF